MCKQLFLTNTAKLDTSKLAKFLYAANKSLCAYEKDGFGYVGTNFDGSLFGERYIKPKDFCFRINKKAFQSSFVRKDKYNVFGKLGKLTGPLLVHGRTSTNNISIQNTHPFLKSNWALVHNGVVEHHGDKYPMESSCDSEHLIQLMSSSGIDKVQSDISGYYAFGAIDPVRKLHVVKDSIASLFVTYIEKIDSLIFCTRSDVIEDICSTMKWKHDTIEELKDNVHLIFKGNELVSEAEISPRGSSTYADSLAEKSLGFSLGASRPNLTALSKPTSALSSYDYSEYAYGDDTTISDYDFLNSENASQFVIIYTDGTELDYADFKYLPKAEKLKCTILDGLGNEIRTGVSALSKWGEVWD